MRPPAASRTAEYMALFRAIESFRRPETRLFHDPFAGEFLRPALRVVASLTRAPILSAAIPRLIDLKWPGARSSGVARTRLIDDLLVDSLRNGIGQVVILGAGFDCRAYRIPEIERARVFEVDHPATLAVKRRCLERALGSLPSHVVLVETDFNRQALPVSLQAAGFDSALRTFYIWEGVTNYLTDQAVDATLRFVGASAPGSRILFTYVHREILQDAAGIAGSRALSRTLRRAGEEWTFGFDPVELPGYLKTRGLELSVDIGSLEYRTRYLKSGGIRLNGYEFYRAALADAIG